MFLFQAVQAALLPRLSRQAAQGAYDEFRSGLKRLMLLVLAVGVAGTVGAFLLGPWALNLVYDADLSGRTLAMLTLSSALYMLALATAQAVIALQGHSLVAIGWVLGLISFVLTTWLTSGELFRRIEIGLVVSSLVALVAFGIALHHRLRIGAMRRSLGDGSDHRHAVRDVRPEAHRRRPTGMRGQPRSGSTLEIASLAGVARPRPARSVELDAGFGGFALQVVGDHHLHERREVDFGFPTQLRARPWSASPINRSTSAGRRNFGS